MQFKVVHSSFVVCFKTESQTNNEKCVFIGAFLTEKRESG